MLQDPRHPHEAGQVLPLVAVIVMLAGVLVLGIARVGTRAATKARAQAAADATALAAVDGDAQVTQRVAAANGAALPNSPVATGGGTAEAGAPLSAALPVGLSRSPTLLRRLRWIGLAFVPSSLTTRGTLKPTFS